MVESYHTECTERSHSRTGSHVSHDQEIEYLRRKLRRREHDRRSPSPPSSEGSSESKDHSYHHRSKTPSSESYLASLCQDKLDKDRNRCGRGSSHRGMGGMMQ